MRLLVQRLRRALGIEPGETGIVVWSAVTLFLIEWASVAVSNTSDTLFLKRVGIDYVPIVFLANSLLLTVTTMLAGNLAVRFDLRRLLTGTFFALAMVLAVLWLLVLAAVPGIATTLVIVSKQIDVIAALVFWTVVGGLMTSRQGKRLVALMTAGGTLGTILGSFTSGPFGKLLGIPSLLAVAALAFLGAALATVPLGRSARPRLYRRGRRSVPEQDQTPHIRAFWRESSLFRVLVSTSFLAGVLGPMLYFVFSYAADEATRTADGEQRLLNLYGLLRGWINVGVLVVQVGGSALLFRRIGVPLSATLAPAAHLLGFAGMSVRFGLPTAMPATIATAVIDHTLADPAQRILAALLPLRMRVAATSVIQGPAKRAGAALGSLLILAVIGMLGEPAHVSMVALPIAAVWMAIALWLWSNYPNLLLEAASVRRADPNEEEPRIAFLDGGTMRTLRQNLESENIGLCRAACGLFVDAPPALAVETLTRALAMAPPANRSLVLETLTAVMADVATPAPAAHRGSPRILLPGNAARVPVAGRVAINMQRALTTASDLSSSERATMLHVLGRASIGRAVPRAIRSLLEEACSDDSPDVRLAAAVACMRAGIGDSSAGAFDDLIVTALDGEDDAARAIAICELRLELMAGDDTDPVWSRRLDLLVRHLSSIRTRPAGEEYDGAGENLRSFVGSKQAVEALADLALTHRERVAEFAPAVLALADDEDVFVRCAVLRFIGNANLIGYARLAADRLSSRNAAEAQAARSALETLGPAAADALLYALRHGSRRARETLPEMLRDIPIEHTALRAVIDREIERSYELLMVIGVLDASAASRLVLQRLRERVEESLRVALDLLAAVNGDERIANVCRSLGRAWNMRDRAVLLEALEALLPAEESSRILPMLEDHGAQHLAATAAQTLDRPLPSLEEAIARAMASRDPLTTALMSATMDRRLLARAAPGLDVEAALRVFSEGHPHAVAVEAIARSAALHPLEQDNAMLSQVETMLHLRALDLFEGLTTRQLAELARVVHEVKVPDGAVIVAEGEFDDRMYFIVHGHVRITKGDQPLAEIGPHDFFGEMAVFDGETRSATAVAVGEVRMLRLSRDDLFEVMEDQPAIGIGICQILVRRVRRLLDERAVIGPDVPANLSGDVPASAPDDVAANVSDDAVPAKADDAPG